LEQGSEDALAASDRPFDARPAWVSSRGAEARVLRTIV
jgi:hypothetical protein